MPDAKPMAAQLEWTVRRLTTSRRMEVSGIQGSRDPGYRNRLEPMAWGTGARTQGQDLSTASGQTGLHSETEQQENATSGDRDDTRSGCPDGGDAGPRTHLRSRPAARAIRVPLRQECA